MQRKKKQTAIEEPHTHTKKNWTKILHGSVS